MAYSNLSGTTMKSFKIGPNGVSLTSTAVTNGESVARKYLKTNQKDGDKELYLAYTDTADPIYDTFIKSSDIASFSYSENKLKIMLRNGSSIDILQDSIIGPNSSVDGAIALFNGTSGKQLKDSEKTISNTINEEAATNDNIVPTTSAVLGYVGTLSDALKKRLEGKI